MAELDSGATPPADQPTVEAPPEQSLAEHEAEFGTPDKRPEADPEPEPEEDSRRAPRDRDEAGKFVKPDKHRARSQEAGARDVPRIQELTRKLREAETERDALRAGPAAPQTPAQVAPAPQPQTVPRGTPAEKRNWATEVARYKAMPDAPKLDDFQEFGDYTTAMDLFIGEQRYAEQTQRAQQQAESDRLSASWRERVAGAKERYQDFEQVALLSPTSIPQGSLIDAWILEHKSGADVLYSLQKDPAELRRILALPMFDQVDALSLIGQRLSQPRTAAVSTGAAPATPRAPAPRPVTPVRTSAVPADDEPPDPEKATLREFERYYHRQRD